MSVYNFIRRGLVRGLAEKTAKSKSMAFKSKSSKSGLKYGLKYYKSDFEVSLVSYYKHL